MSMSSQFVNSSGPLITMQLDMAMATLGLSAEQSKEIFLLAQEGKKLGTRIAQNFINLSSQVLFCMGAQSTGYKVASGHPNHLTAYYVIMCSEGEQVKDLDEAVDHLCKKVGKHGWRPTPCCSDTPWNMKQN